MRNISVIILVLIFMISSFRSWLPQLDYAINKNYLAQVLCENKKVQESQCEGQCYLKKQIKKSTEQEKDNKQISIKSIDIIYFNFINITIPETQEKIRKKVNLPLTINLPDYFLELQSPPPKQLYC